MSSERPINADVQAPEGAPEPVAEPKSAGERPPVAAPEEPREPPREERPEPARRRRRRGTIPGPIKLVAVLVAIAIGFIVLAVVAGSGSKQGGGSAAPTPSTTAGAAPVESGSPEGTTTESESEASGAAAEELGFPSFATSNTTRIGGPDPVSNAAATALAVFPATDAKQRPVAVALVGKEDWAGAIAAGVLMAEPVKAPLLYGEPEGIPDATSAALTALQPRGGAASDGDAILAIGDVQVPSGMSAAKVAAGDAATEAAAIARLRDRLAGSPPQAILLASSSEPAFATPAAAYAARSGDPVLFTEAEALPQATLAALRRDKGVPVYALGPGSAISEKVLKEVGKLGDKVTRISGADPVATAIAFARYGGDKFGWHVSDPGHGFVLARADAPLEAAAAAPLSASGTWGPLLLTDSADTLPSELRGYFLDVKPGYTTDPTRAFYNHVWIVGDVGQISVGQQAEVNEVAELAKIGAEG
ncbi:MAG TPA: cell wall-binding repeat-containing protein [Solirubrobacterales bacterium]|nr:cell wall-binding repeat-containing protein [Solirubrobacterales bacterium]